jgi:hypothetical protein
MTATDEQYVPGVCNIGAGEVRKRGTVGWIGLIATIVIWAAFVALNTAPHWRLLLFVPAMISALGFLQARQHFCIKYGFRGTHKFGRDVGEPDPADRTDSRRKDRRTSLAILGLAALVGAASAAAAYFAPL